MYRIYILLTVNLLGTASMSQGHDFDSIYRVTTTEKIYSDPKKALENADYLFSIASDKTQQVRSLLLKSEIFRMSGLNKDAIHSLLMAESLVNAEKHSQRLLIHGLLATNYRESGQLYFAQQHLEKSEQVVAHIQDLEEKHKLLGNINQEKAYTEMERNEFENAISYIHKSTGHLSKMDSIKSNLNFSYALNNQIIGQNYLKLKSQDSALFYFEKAMGHLERSHAPGSSLRGYILDGMANTAILKGDFENVEAYFIEATEIAKAGNNFSLQKTIYQSMIDFFKDREEHKKYIEANEEFLTLIKNENARQAIVRESIFDFLEKQQVSPDREQSSISWQIVTVGGIIILLAFFFWKKKPTSNIHPINGEQPNKDGQLKKNQQEKQVEGTKDYVSPDIMDSIVADLKELESKQFYLDKNVSVASVATEVGANHRYLSHTINRKYGKDFTTYVNDLRISYIIDFLKENPQHLNYKISYLAEKAGFSSHNRFSIVFKKSTGISPSELIDTLQKEQQEKNLKIKQQPHIGK